MKTKPERDRELAVRRYLDGEQASSIAGALGYSRRWIYKWIERHDNDSEGSWYEELSRRPHRNSRSMEAMTVELVRTTRLKLSNQGLFCGAQMIEWELQELGVEPVPSIRSINRILGLEGLKDRRTGRYEAKGKKYPALIGRYANEVHQMDFVGPCYLKGPVRFYSLNSVDLATGRCALNPVVCKAGQNTVDAIWSIWRRLGIPDHQQVDNELVFYGSRRFPRGMGNLIRLCLLNGVEPWFIPMAEPWRNGVVEKFNDHFRQLFLSRVVMRTERDLQRQSLIFEQKHNSRYRYSKLNGRTPKAALDQSQRKIRFPSSPKAPPCPLPKPDHGKYHLVRFIRGDRKLDIFGEKFLLPKVATYEYVVATVDVGRQRLTVKTDEATIDERKYQAG